MNIRPIHPPTTPEAIQAFEAQIGAQLPDDYKLFLLTQNGGTISSLLVYRRAKTSGCIPVAPEEHLAETEIEGIRILFGLSGQAKNKNSLERQFRLYGNDVPKGFLIIGRDYFSEIILISLRRDTYGRIYYLEREGLEIPDEVLAEWGECYNVYFIANSFTEFLDGLYEDLE